MRKKSVKNKCSSEKHEPNWPVFVANSKFGEIHLSLQCLDVLKWGFQWGRILFHWRYSRHRGKARPGLLSTQELCKYASRWSAFKPAVHVTRFSFCLFSPRWSPHVGAWWGSTPPTTTAWRRCCLDSAAPWRSGSHLTKTTKKRRTKRPRRFSLHWRILPERLGSYSPAQLISLQIAFRSVFLLTK